MERGTRRRRPTSLQEEGWDFVLEFPSLLSDLLYGTTYNTRGWTFQELILSKRLLFVTEQQLVYHCATSRHSESIPDAELQLQMLEAEHENSIAGFDHLSPPDDDRDLRERYRAIVLQYSRRQLSFPSDIENACAGLASILAKWSHNSTVVHGMLLNFFGQSIAWTFDDDIDLLECHPKAKRGKRREGFPSWSWVGWVANISSLMEPWARVTSLIDNVNITCFSKNIVLSSFFYVSDKYVEDDATSMPLQIRINMAPAMLDDSDSASLSTFAFEGNRTDWRNFTAYFRTRASGNSLGFRRAGENALCGMIGVTPDDDIVDELCNHTAHSEQGALGKWSLVQLCRQQLNSDILLEEDTEDASEFIPDYENDFYKKFTGQMYALHVLLLRRTGYYWERVGSGFMMESAWPSNSEQAAPQSFHERLILI